MQSTTCPLRCLALRLAAPSFVQCTSESPKKAACSACARSRMSCSGSSGIHRSPAVPSVARATSASSPPSSVRTRAWCLVSLRASSATRSRPRAPARRARPAAPQAAGPGSRRQSVAGPGRAGCLGARGGQDLRSRRAVRPAQRECATARAARARRVGGSRRRPPAAPAAPGARRRAAAAVAGWAGGRAPRGARGPRVCAAWRRRSARGARGGVGAYTPSFLGPQAIYTHRHHCQSASQRRADADLVTSEFSRSVEPAATPV